MKSSHCFTFCFDHKLLLEEYEKAAVVCEKHFNSGFYEGEWSRFALRKPTDDNFDLFVDSNQTDEYINAGLSNMLPETQKVLDFFPCEKASVRVLKLIPESSIKLYSMKA